MQSRNRTNTARGSDLGRILTTRTLKGGWCGGDALGATCAQVMKFTIGMDGVIPLMGGKDEVRGGKGFHDVVITVEYGVASGRVTT